MRWLLFLFSHPGAASVRLRRGQREPCAFLRELRGRLGRAALCAPSPPTRSSAASRTLRCGAGGSAQRRPEVWELRRARVQRCLGFFCPEERGPDEFNLKIQIIPSVLCTVSALLCQDFESDNPSGPISERQGLWECLGREGDEHLLF